LLPGHDPVQKVTIVPRGRALGLTWTLPIDDRLSLTKMAILKKIAMMMGGRAAEEVGMSSLTGGSANDLQQATRLARHMVCNLGMSEDLGPVSWGEGEQEVFLGRQMTATKGYSEQTARRIDEEVRAILTRGYEAATAILVANAHVLHRVANTLMERESLDGDEFEALVKEAGPVPPDGLSWMGV
jgi:cell division protease FtsH